MKEHSLKDKPQPAAYPGVPDGYNELARRLMASVLAYTLGLAGVDRTLKRYVPPVADCTWCEEARRLQAKMMQDLEENRRLQRLSL